jgi:hypothetical protein
VCFHGKTPTHYLCDLPQSLASFELLTTIWWFFDFVMTFGFGFVENLKIKETLVLRIQKKFQKKYLLVLGFCKRINGFQQLNTQSKNLP